MLKYLRTLPQIRHAAAGEYVVVTGNQAADMDSCCSALIAAYLETVSGRRAVPLIQVPRHDLVLRKDIEYVFAQLGIESEWLFYADTLKTSDLTPLFLVDHNAATLEGKVCAVIDHHELEPGSATTHSGVDPNVLVKCGSCMSAVVDHYTKTLPNAAELFRSDKVLAPLALMPILLDTANLENKTEGLDRTAVKFLSQFNMQFSPFESLVTVKREKSSIEGISPTDLLRKDYKKWGTIGISSLPKVFEKLGYDSYVLGRAMLTHKQQAHLDVMVALGSGKRKGVYKRQLAIAAPRNFDVVASCPSLELALVSDEDDVRYYDQRNTAASRKQVAPQICQAWDRYISKH